MSNAIVARKESLQNLAVFLDKRRTFIAKVIPRHLTPDRVVKVAITAASRTPKLLECTPESFALAVIQASQLGLEAGSPLGEAYLVPYGKECTLIVGYRGLIALARRSGEIESIEAHVVHARDRFELTFGLDAKLSHTPHMPAPPRAADGDAAMKAWAEDADPGTMVAVYAIARLKGGAVQYEVMTRAQVDAIRARSRSSGNGPWVTDYEEMARKTVVRRLAKYLPMSIEMAQAIDLDDRQESGEGLAEIADIEISSAVDAKPATKPSATDAMKATLAAKINGKPDGDDEPPPNGTDGRGKGSAEEGNDDASAAAFEAHRAANGEQASADWRASAAGITAHVATLGPKHLENSGRAHLRAIRASLREHAVNAYADRLRALSQRTERDEEGNAVVTEMPARECFARVEGWLREGPRVAAIAPQRREDQAA